MPRAHRIHLPGHVWHLTHRCHRRQFLLQFVRDRRLWRRWLYEARRRYDFIVIDTPPLVLVSDCRIIADLVDGIVLVVSAHRTPRGPLEEALRIIDPAKVLGFVLNNADVPLFGYPYA